MPNTNIVTQGLTIEEMEAIRIEHLDPEVEALKAKFKRRLAEAQLQLVLANNEIFKLRYQIIVTFSEAVVDEILDDR
jgi:hypothetical protein